MSKKQPEANLPTSSPAENSWIISVILEQAYNRWKNKFLAFLAMYFIVAGIWIGAEIIVGLLVLSISVIGIIFLKSTILAIVVCIIGILITLFISLYLFSLLTLANVKLFMDQDCSISQAIHLVRPQVVPYMRVWIPAGFFLTGFMSIGLISFLIIPLLWSFWSSFTTFVFLHHREKGLKNLWVSKAMYNRHFKILLIRSLIPFVVGMLISIPHIAASYFFTQQGIVYNGIYILSFFLNLIFMSFLICYNFELFRRIDKPVQVNTPKIWIGISICGWIFTLLLMLFFSFIIIQYSPVLSSLYQHSQVSISNQQKVFVPQDPNIRYYKGRENQTVQTNDRKFTISHVNLHYPSQPSDELPPTRHFIVLSVTLENTGQESIDFSPYDFFIQNSHGDLQGPGYIFSIPDNSLLGSGKLAPGAIKTGIVLFSVDTTTAPFTLIYKPYPTAANKSFIIEEQL